MTHLSSLLRNAQFLAASCAILMSMGSRAQHTEAPDHDPLGHRDFTASCAGCHGLDGRGGERGPDIAARKDVRQLSDGALLEIVENGIAGTGMPAFRQLEKSRIEAIVGYLRKLQGKTGSAKSPGDPTTGRAVFFGRAQCSQCHAIEGQGGVIGSDLFGYAGSLSVDELREAIRSAGTAGARAHRLVGAKRGEGQRLEGIIRNEDNFSLQLQTLDGAFHSLRKPILENTPGSTQVSLLMDYFVQLSHSDLDDVISFLMANGRKNGGESLLDPSAKQSNQKENR